MALFRLFLIIWLFLIGGAEACCQSATTAPDKPVFDVAVIRESGKRDASFYEFPADSSLFIAHQITLQGLIITAYNIKFFHLLDLPQEWAVDTRYDIEAKAGEQLDKEFSRMPANEAYQVKREMLQRLLAERFHLRIHQRGVPGTIYELVPTGKSDALLHAAVTDNKAEPVDEDSPLSCGEVLFSSSGLDLVAKSCSMKSFVSYLKLSMSTEVVDHTNLHGRYQFELKWKDPISHMTENDSFYPPLIQAIQEQVGLKLRPVHGTINKWVVDHVERPTPN